MTDIDLDTAIAALDEARSSLSSLTRSLASSAAIVAQYLAKSVAVGTRVVIDENIYRVALVRWNGIDHTKTINRSSVRARVLLRNNVPLHDPRTGFDLHAVHYEPCELALYEFEDRYAFPTDADLLNFIRDTPVLTQRLTDDTRTRIHKLATSARDAFDKLAKANERHTKSKGPSS